MQLTPREIEKLYIYQVAELARRRRGRGLRLNYAEAIALITEAILEGARDGRTVAELMDVGRSVLRPADVMPEVPEMLHLVQVEATFPDGTKLVSCHDPIAADAIEPGGPAPDAETGYAQHSAAAGEVGRPLPRYLLGDDAVEINAGRRKTSVLVENTGDRPVQVGSHYHFFEANRALRFDREAAFGMRLDIPAGTAVRFEPGDTRQVDLVAYAGTQRVVGFSGAVNGSVAGRRRGTGDLMPALPRRRYVDLYGPTTGDRFRLADTVLYAAVERDYLTHGDEAIFGGGKTIRDGMGQAPGVTNAQGALDLVITSVLILDPLLGVIKADLGIKDGRIAGIGKAGNPYVMDGVDPRLVIGAGTEVIAGEHLIATPGGIDAHIHMISPQQVYEALCNGITTFIGGGTGPADGTNATTCTPGPWNLARMLQACEGLPVNWGFLGKGNSSLPAPLVEQIEAGACGLKDHEDWGTTPAAIDSSLKVADEYDVQVAIHTDTLNESGFLEDTVAAIDGRTIHTYHTEGAGGGHAPDIIRIAGEPNVLPSSTNPTRPFTINTLDEHLDMLMVCHHLNPDVPEDVAFAESRIRAETIAAEDVLHDLGVLSMYSSDSQAMGRVGESYAKLFQTADKMRRQRGPLAADEGTGNDNARILRYLAKLTINPAIAHGIAHEVGSLEPGKLADIVLWSIPFFGAKPKLVLKGGFIAWAAMGDPNASIPTPEPVFYRPMFGAFGQAMDATCVTFVSQASLDRRIGERIGLRRRLVAVRGCRTLGKGHMVRNDAQPRIEVDPETYEVHVDGELATCEPATRLSHAQLYYIV